ncbi:MAG TPA: DUF3443 family protein [Ramlibacter sp.]|uniref:DUF3443 family protein n=1 Tax=Ramlibacter sp. TaxID=1917967 RepID=UPI002D2C1560|nr:DUF3443 family protein [Ramlibacter sp.]HZY19357.1 DUF3443 family protein [Ramlibacter sp.]
MTRPQLLRFASWLPAFLLFTFLAGCGGGGGGSPAPTRLQNTNTVAGPSIPGGNVLAIRVDRGTDGSAFNSPFVTVTICEPGTSTCVDVDRVIVDTGSNGLRLSASALSGVTLPRVTNASSDPVGECAQFASGFTWGGVRRADVRLATLTAPSVPIQVIADGQLPVPPAACSGTGANLGASSGINGILGVGLREQDCGTSCATTLTGVYYGCSGNACTATRLPVASQVTNPVSRLPTDNNGVVVVLPPVPTGGAAVVTGSLVLGIDTQPNNQLGSATVLTADAQGFFTTVYNGVTYPKSFLDSGSNGLFFADPGIPNCSPNPDFYCPTSTLALNATQIGANGTSRAIDFTIESVGALTANTAAANVAGSAGSLTQSFDWGLPFFFGRSVYVAISGAGTSAGPGPFWAY